MRRSRLLLAVLATAVSPAGAGAADDLWATVNVCDSARHPYEVGIRGSMPGVPSGTGRQMRFRLQYRAGDTWRYVEEADSGWKPLPRSHGRPIESGWSFTFPPPSRAVSFRGVVRFKWLRGDRVVRRALEITETGHRSTKGADPEGYSAAVCSMG